MSDQDRPTCPNCGATPRKDRYPAHVDACTGDPPSIEWYWSQGWRDKLNVLAVTAGVIALAGLAKVVESWKDAVENARGGE